MKLAQRNSRLSSIVSCSASTSFSSSLKYVNQVCDGNGLFNDRAVTARDCLRCFCFGITDQCSSTELYMSKNDVIIQAVVAVDNNAPIGQKINPGKEVVSCDGKIRIFCAQRKRKWIF